MLLSYSSICMALYKCMTHVSLLFCSWNAQVKIKSPMIIVRTTALPSNWAKTDWKAGNTESNTEYTNWQQVPCCHTCFYYCFFMEYDIQFICCSCKITEINRKHFMWPLHIAFSHGQKLLNNQFLHNLNFIEDKESMKEHTLVRFSLM